jgi:hypothetical protein
MTKIARAAELWARLEKRLINRCGLPNGRMLDVERPNLISSIGNALVGGRAIQHARIADGTEIAGRAAAVTNVSPPLPQQDAYAKRIKVRPDKMRPDTVHDPKLAAMLEQSCSRRTGYDGDDTVSYERG